MAEITQDRMDYISHIALMPVTLLINFSLCQYLFATYHERRREPRVMLLLACSILGFISIIPFSTPDNTVFEYLDGISETASTLTFLLQVAILGRDINRKVRIASLVHMTRVAEAFVIVELVLILASVVKLCDHTLQADWLNTVIQTVEDVALWFIFFARFYYIAMAHGLTKTIATKRMEIFLYLLFVTHAYPFMYLDYTTHISWEPVRALWYRLTLMLCILHTIRDKIRSTMSSKQLKTGASRATRATKQSGARSELPTLGEKTGPTVKAASQRHAAPTTTPKGVSANSVNRVGISLRSVVPLGKQVPRLIDTGRGH
jgi:hypothetical protein